MLEERGAAEEIWSPPPLRGALITLLGIALLAAVVLAIEPLRTGVSDTVQGDTGALRRELRELGVVGALIVYALALVHAFVWYPAEILDTAAGYVWDFWVALPLVMSAWLLNGLVAYWIGRHAARPVLYRAFGRDRFTRYERAIARGGVTLLLAMRLVPIVPFSLFSYVAGSARVPAPTFLWTTAIGYLPITAVFIYFGSQLEDLSLEDPILWLAILVLVALLLVTRRAARLMRRGGEPPGVAEREHAGSR